MVIEYEIEELPPIGLLDSSWTIKSIAGVRLYRTYDSFDDANRSAIEFIESAGHTPKRIGGEDGDS